MHGAGRGAPLLLVLLLWLVLLLLLWLVLLLVRQGRVIYPTPLCPRPHVVGTKYRGRGGGSGRLSFS